MGHKRHGIGRRAELRTAHGNPGNRARLHCQRHPVADSLLGGYIGDLLRHAGAQIDDRSIGQLHGGTAGHHLLGVQRNFRNGIQRNAEIPCQAAVIGHAHTLEAILRGAYHQHIHADAGNGHQPGIQRSALHHLFHLDDHLSAGIVAGLRHGGHIQRADLPVHGTVAVLIPVTGPEKHYMDGECLIQQAFLPLNIDQFDKVLRGSAVELTAAVAGIHKGVQAHMGNGADLMGGNIAVHMTDHTLGQIIGLKFTGQRHLTQLRRPVPMAADSPLEHPLVRVAVTAAAVPVALTGGKKQRQVTGMPRFQKALFQRFVQRLRRTGTQETSGGNRVAIVNQQRGLLRRNDRYLSHLLSSSLIFKGSGVPASHTGAPNCQPPIGWPYCFTVYHIQRQMAHFFSKTAPAPAKAQVLNGNAVFFAGSVFAQLRPYPVKERCQTAALSPAPLPQLPGFASTLFCETPPPKCQNGYIPPTIK